MNVSSILPVGKTDFFEEERASLREAFLRREGLEKELLIPLPVDCSKRRYFRLSHALLMDAPPPHEDTSRFQCVAELLQGTGLSVPQIYAADHVDGFLLIEDFGELPYRKALQEGVSEKLLYKEAVKALVYLHQKLPENTMNFPSYDNNLFLNKANDFLAWCDLSLSSEAQSSFQEVWKEAYQNQPLIPQRLMMRDVMVDNLLWLPLRQGLQRCGFIDFQDALWGPISYDLVSLLEDARRDVAPHFAKDMLSIYLTAFPDLSKDDFEASYSLWGAQRSTRILGLFYRLAKKDNKPQYLAHVPRVWAYLKRDLQYPHLKAVRQWFDTYGGDPWQKVR